MSSIDEDLAEGLNPASNGTTTPSTLTVVQVGATNTGGAAGGSSTGHNGGVSSNFTQFSPPEKQFEINAAFNTTLGSISRPTSLVCIDRQKASIAGRPLHKPRFNAGNHSLFDIDFLSPVHKTGRPNSPVQAPGMDRLIEGTFKPSNAENYASPFTSTPATKRRRSSQTTPPQPITSEGKNKPPKRPKNKHKQISLVNQPTIKQFLTDPVINSTGNLHNIVSPNFTEGLVSPNTVPKCISPVRSHPTEPMYISNNVPECTISPVRPYISYNDCELIDTDFDNLSIADTNSSSEFLDSKTVNNTISVSFQTNAPIRIESPADILIDNSQYPAIIADINSGPNQGTSENTNLSDIQQISSTEPANTQQNCSPDTIVISNANIAIPKSILKIPNVDLISTNTHTKSVIFQNTLRIPENILPSWRRARSALATAAKATLRAHHFRSLRTMAQPTLWALGVGKYPHFLPLDTQAKTALVNSRKAHAFDCMNIVQSSLERKADAEVSLGTTFSAATIKLYGGNTQAKPAMDLLDTLLDKERVSTMQTLNTRAANAQANPVTNDFILSTMVADTSAPTANPPAPTSTRGRGRGRGQQQQRQRRSPSPRAGFARGSGRPRGRGASRGGRGGYKGTQSRSRSPNNRATKQANELRALTAYDIMVLNTLRSAKGQPPL